jgi:hypothetical protein
MYQYQTGLGWWVPPADEDELLGVTYGGDPNTGDPDYAGGMPVLWESWWDVGIVALGSARPVEYMVGVVSGAPGWATAGEEENSGKSVIARVGLAPIPALRVGVSGSHGPYVNDVGAFLVPPGKSVNDYDQDLVMADAEVCSATPELRGEGFRNVWETPTVGDLRVSGFYVEGKYTLAAGLYVASRYEQERLQQDRRIGRRAAPVAPRTSTASSRGWATAQPCAAREDGVAAVHEAGRGAGAGRRRRPVRREPSSSASRETFRTSRGVRVHASAAAAG